MASAGDSDSAKDQSSTVDDSTLISVKTKPESDVDPELEAILDSKIKHTLHSEYRFIDLDLDSTIF